MQKIRRNSRHVYIKLTHGQNSKLNDVAINIMTKCINRCGK